MKRHAKHAQLHCEHGVVLATWVVSLSDVVLSAVNFRLLERVHPLFM